MPTDETQPGLDAYAPVYAFNSLGQPRFSLAPGHLSRIGEDETAERLAQGLCGLAFWAGQLQGENEKLRQEALAAPRGDEGPMGGAAQALLAHELREATEALRGTEVERDHAQGRCAELHAQVQELVERNTALEQEVEDFKAGSWKMKDVEAELDAKADAQQEAERWRLAAESLEQRLTKALAELAPYRALVDGFARELGEVLLKRALGVRT